MPKLSTHQKAIRRVLSRALDAATPDLPDIAKDAGLSVHALRQYKRGKRTPKPEVLRAIVVALRHRSARLAELADELEALREKDAPAR